MRERIEFTVFMIKRFSINKLAFSIIILLTVMIAGCKKNSNIELAKLPLTNIHKDPIFKEFIINTQNQFNSVRDFSALKTYMTDGKISKAEADLLPSLYGYYNREEFLAAFIHLSNIKSYLLNKYDFKASSYDDKKEAILKTFEQINELKSFQTTYQAPLKASSNSVVSTFIVDDCEKIRRNCILSVAAEATIMHIGCAALDVTILLGIACHSAATLYQYTAGENCNLEASRCK